jgi:hypothetical protein
MERTAEVTQLVEGFEMEPSKADLREISRDLHREKGKSQMMG